MHGRSFSFGFRGLMGHFPFPPFLPPLFLSPPLLSPPLLSIPSYPSPSFPPLLSSPPFQSLPLSPLLGVPSHPLIRLGGLGERSSSPSESGRSPAARRFLVHFRLKRTLLVITIMEEVLHQSHHHQTEYLTEIEHLVQHTSQYHMLHNLCFFSLASYR